MCRLFGLVASKPVDVHFSFNQAENNFVSQSAANPDGWGIGWYDDRGTASVFKEPIQAGDSGALPTKIREIKSSLIVAHVRKGTQGGRTWHNTHPFQYEDWIFAHNGSIKTCSELRQLLSPESQRLIQGKTDSEIYFYWILQRIREENGSVEKGVAKAVAEVVRHHQYSGLNFLLTNGSNLYAFRYGSCSPEYYSMFYLQRGRNSLRYLHSVSQSTKQLIEYKVRENEEAVLIASEKLTTGENWQEIPWGALAIIKPSLDIEIDHIF